MGQLIPNYSPSLAFIRYFQPAASDKMREKLILALDVMSLSNASVYAGGYEDCYAELEKNGKMKMLQWTTAMLGATLFVLCSKVHLQLLLPI